MDKQVIINTLKYVNGHSRKDLNSYLKDDNENQLALLYCIKNRYIAGLIGGENAAGGAIFESIDTDVTITELGQVVLNEV